MLALAEYGGDKSHTDGIKFTQDNVGENLGL